MHDYQGRIVEHICTNKQSMVWVGLGLGKTVSTLTAIVDLMNSMEVYGVLILAPLRVVQTVWAQEGGKWEHTQGLTFSLIHGKPEEREWALRRPVNVYLLNYEGSQWAVDQFINHYLVNGKPLPFNMIVFDEVTRLKSSRSRQGGAWGKAISKILQYVPWRVGLTATPASNGLQDLFGQYLMVDDGERLGSSYSNFEASYFQTDYSGYNVTVTQDGEGFIKSRISDITIQMDAADYLELPPVTVNDIEVELTPKLRKQYTKLEKEMMLELDTGSLVDAMNAAVLSGKVRQFTNGAMYVDQVERDKWEGIHNLKLDALMEVVDSLNGSPLLLSYVFKHDAIRIKERFTKSGVEFEHFTSKVQGDEVTELMDRWNSGKLQVLMGHPASIGHGLNCQYSCNNICWFGLNWSLELYDQFNGRVARQGQEKHVIIHRLLVKDTIDKLISIKLRNKSDSQDGIRKAIKEYRNEFNLQ